MSVPTNTLAKERTFVERYQEYKYDIDLLSMFLYYRCETNSYFERIAISNIMINRINSNLYPDNMRDVIYEALNGQWWIISEEYTEWECNPAREVIMGGTRIFSDNALDISKIYEYDVYKIDI